MQCLAGCLKNMKSTKGKCKERKEPLENRKCVKHKLSTDSLSVSLLRNQVSVDYSFYICLWYKHCINGYSLEDCLLLLDNFNSLDCGGVFYYYILKLLKKQDSQ